MKKYPLLLLLLTTSLFAQKQGQKFCDGYDDSSYFTLLEKKKILWQNTYYFETYEGEITLNGNKYLKYKQKWQNGHIEYLYLRDEDGKVLQYEECCKTETVRYDEFFEPGQTWQDLNKEVTYTLISYTDTLATPYCTYTGLMSIKADYKTIAYTFYYQKGNGYIGAAVDGKIMSCITPEW